MKSHTALLKRMDACSEAVAFADQHRSLKAAWEACTRPDWMLWLLGAVTHEDDKTYRLYACWCARNTPLANGRKVWDLLTDKRSRDAVEVAERFAVGEATREELAAAWDAAWDAAWAAAWAARDAAWDAAWAAAWAARAAARAAAGDAAWDAAWAAQSDQLRIMFPWPVVAGAIKKYKEAKP